MTTGVPFLDEETVEGLGWAEVWSMFMPLTPYGIEIRSVMEAYRCGQESLLRETLRQLEQDAQWLAVSSTRDTLDKLEQMLRGLPDIRGVVHALAHPQSVLGMKDLLSLKKFVWTVWASTHIEGEGLTFPFTSTRGWAELRSLYGSETGTSLSIESIGGDRIREASQAYAQALAWRAQVDKAVSDEWIEQTGYRPSRERQLVVPMPEGRDIAARLKSHSGVTWLRDTPFESVFEVLQTNNQKLADEQVDRTLRELTVAQDEVLHLFSVELRNRLDTIKTMVADVSKLDIRLAKVRMMERMEGSIPEISLSHDEATSLFVEGAIHPIAKGQRESHGASFHPFDWSLSAPLNIVCGPNMSGKTVAMQTWCILQALTQFGLPVPAKRMKTRLFDAIRFSSSAETDVHLGLSAFGREMVRVAEVADLVSASQNALVCFDEPCRSTNPLEGEALAQALALYFRDCLGNKGLCLITTHYPGVITLPGAAVFQVSGWDETLKAWLDEASKDARERAVGERGSGKDAGERAVAERDSGGRSPGGKDAGTKAVLNWQERLAAVERRTKYTITPASDKEVQSFAIRTAELLGVPHGMIERACSFGQRRTTQ